MAAAPTSSSEFLDLLTKSGIIDNAGLAALGDLPAEPTQCAAALIGKGIITKFQAKLLLNGRYKGFKLGAYYIREQIGHGGMGAVYLAEHETLKRRVALKVLTMAKDGNNALNIERFLREARSAAALDHPNIVRLHDVGKSGDTHYLVMEYVEGQTLDQIVTRSGPISSSRAVEYIAQAAAGLQHAFERGFVHRDIKPANLMLAKDGTIKILDMGLARPTDESAEKLTEIMDKGAIVGTADYISPEQAMNGPLDVRSDIYSLGATFYAMVTGQPPFSGNTTQKLLQHQMKAAPSVTSLDKTFPAGLSAVVAKMLAKKPEQRYQSPADVIKALAEWLPQQASARMQAALSSTELSRSEEMQTTLSEIANGTQRLGSKAKLAKAIADSQSKKWFWPAVAASVLLLAGGTAAVVAFSGGQPKPETMVADASLDKPNPGSAATIPPAKVPEIKPVAVKPPEPKKNPAGPPVAKKDPPVSTPVAIVPAKEPPPLLYKLDFKDQKSFMLRGHTEGLAPPKAWVNDEKTGDGKLPRGWAVSPTRNETVVEYGSKLVDAQPAIGYRVVSGLPAISVIMPKFTTPSGKILVNMKYTSDGTSGTTLLRYVQETPAKKAVVVLDILPIAKAGQWQDYSKEFDLKGGSGGYLELFSAASGNDFVWISNFAIFQGGSPGERPARDVPLYSVNFASLKLAEFKSENSTKNFQMRELGNQVLPGGLFINQTRLKISCEYCIADVAGVRALGFMQSDGPAGLQIQTSAGEALGLLKPGDKASIQVTYRFEGSGKGMMCLQKTGKIPERTIKEPFLPTGGEWKVAEMKFVRPDSEEGFDLVLTAGNAEFYTRAEGMIWIKSIEIKYADAK